MVQSLTMLSSYKLFQKERIVDVLIMSLLVTFTLVLRIPIAAERKILPAGDAFNFQHITSHIQHLSYPSKEKRLPVYSIILLAGRVANLDHIQASVATSIAAGAGIPVLLYALGRQLRLHRVPLTGFLGLSAFDPLLTMNGIRPLADSTFLFFALLFILLLTRILSRPDPPSHRFLWGLGATATLMMFTRYEGFLIAGLLYPLLLLKLPWRDALRAAIIPITATLAWIPAYLAIHGSLTGLSYVADASGSGFGQISDIPDNANQMIEGAGWGKAWSLPAYEVSQEPQAEAVPRLLATPTWWMGLMGAIGLGWVAVRSKIAGLPLLAAATGYTLLLAWWWVYSRYVAPLSAIFYLTTAAGASAILATPLMFGSLRTRKVAQALLLLVFLGGFWWIATTETTAMHTRALSLAWESNYKEYALFSALQNTASKGKPTAYWTEEHAFATLYLGLLEEPASRTNPKLGLYFSRYPDADAAALYEILQQRRIRYLIYAEQHDNATEPRLPPLRELLVQRNRIAGETTFRSVHLTEGDLQEIPVYELAWE